MHRPPPRQFLLRQSQRTGPSINFRLTHRLPLHSRSQPWRPSTQPGPRGSGAREAERLWPQPPASEVPSTRLPVTPGSPALDSSGGEAKGPRGRRGREGCGGSGRLESRGPGVGEGGRGKPRSRADLFTSKRPRAFQTSRRRARGGSYCLLAGPTGNPLVGGGWGRRRRAWLGQRRDGRLTAGALALQCRPEDAGLRAPDRFIDSGDPPMPWSQDSWGRAARPRGASYPTPSTEFSTFQRKTRSKKD